MKTSRARWPLFALAVLLAVGRAECGEPIPIEPEARVIEEVIGRELPLIRPPGVRPPSVRPPAVRPPTVRPPAVRSPTVELPPTVRPGRLPGVEVQGTVGGVRPPAVGVPLRGGAHVEPTARPLALDAFPLRKPTAERVPAGDLRRLAVGLEEFRAPGLQRDAGALRRLADNHLGIPNLAPDLEQTLSLVRAHTQALEDLTRLQAALARGESQRLPNVDLSQWPLGLERRTRGLTSLARLRETISGRWQAAPDVDLLERQLADLLDLTGDARLTTSTQRCLAYKARLEGYPEAAEKLLPPGHSAAEDRLRLRDLKVVPRSEGSAGPRAARLAAAPDDVGAGPVGPRPLTPVPDAGGVRPATAERPRAGLPPLDDDLAAPERHAQKDLTEETEREIDRQWHALHPLLHRLHEYGQLAHGLSRRQPSPQGEKQADEPPTAMVARLLRRELTPAERVLVSAMHRQGKKPDEVAAILRALETPAAKP
jgi:hypothetical protein